MDGNGAGVGFCMSFFCGPFASTLDDESVGFSSRRDDPSSKEFSPSWVAAARVRACARYGVLVVGEEMKGLVLSRCSAAVTGVELARIIWCPSVRRSRGPTRPHETSHSPGNQLLLGKSNHGASLRSATGQNWRG